MDFRTLFEERSKNLDLKEGQCVAGRVVAVRRDHVMVDVGFKSEGMIELEEFRNFDGQITVAQGDQVKVVVEQLEDPNGLIVLSKERADAMESWDRVEAVYQKNEFIEGVVVNKIKGGMSVNLGGIKAFLPASQIDLKPIKSLDKMVNKKFKFKILKLNKVKGNIVLSRRAVLEEERATQKKDLLLNLKEGQVVQGVVKNITDYGAFVDLGGIDGLLHITDITWSRGGHPSDVLKVGEEIEVVVLKYDPENEKVSLGYKQLRPDPWDEVDKKFTPGERVKGKIVNVTDYGVFIELADGIEGLVHVSELTWNKKIKHPSKLVKVGDMLEAVILDLDSANRRISLGAKQLEPNPWDHLETQYPSGTRVKGVVRNITDFGVFVGIEGEEIDGLVHISDLSWDKNISHPSEILKKGDEVEAIVISVDKGGERFALGIKQLNDDPWDVVRKNFSIGSMVEGDVEDVQAKGILINLDQGIKGFIANADISQEKEKPAFKNGDRLKAQVKKLDERARRVILSIKAFDKSQERENMKAFMARQGDDSVKLKDAVKQ